MKIDNQEIFPNVRVRSMDISCLDAFYGAIDANRSSLSLVGVTKDSPTRNDVEAMLTATTAKSEIERTSFGAWVLTATTDELFLGNVNFRPHNTVLPEEVIATLPSGHELEVWEISYWRDKQSKIIRDSLQELANSEGPYSLAATRHIMAKAVGLACLEFIEQRPGITVVAFVDDTNQPSKTLLSNLGQYPLHAQPIERQIEHCPDQFGKYWSLNPAAVRHALGTGM